MCLLVTPRVLLCCCVRGWLGSCPCFLNGMGALIDVLSESVLRCAYSLPSLSCCAAVCGGGCSVGQLHTGGLVVGVVTSITPFGVFVRMLGKVGQRTPHVLPVRCGLCPVA